MPHVCHKIKTDGKKQLVNQVFSSMCINSAVVLSFIVESNSNNLFLISKFTDDGFIYFAVSPKLRC